MATSVQGLRSGAALRLLLIIYGEEYNIWCTVWYDLNLFDIFCSNGVYVCGQWALWYNNLFKWKLISALGKR